MREQMVGLKKQKGSISSLIRYPEKKAPAMIEEALVFQKDMGIQGDYHGDGGERQISLLSVREKEWMQSQQLKGFCFKKYRENILLNGISLQECKEGDLLFCGEVVLELTSTIKSCHSELCKLAEDGVCILAGSSRFAKVKKGGIIKTGMEVTVVYR